MACRIELAASEIADEAIRRMNKRITNEVFLTIQKDPDLMKEYLRAIQDSGLDVVNQTIVVCPPQRSPVVMLDWN